MRGEVLPLILLLLTSRHRSTCQSEEKDDLYPTISICLYGKGGKIFKRRKLEKAQMCRVCKDQLTGCEQNNTILIACGAREYFLAMSGNIESINITSFPFEGLTYDAREFVLDYKINNQTPSYFKNKQLYCV